MDFTASSNGFFNAVVFGALNRDLHSHWGCGSGDGAASQTAPATPSGLRSSIMQWTESALGTPSRCRAQFVGSPGQESTSVPLSAPTCMAVPEQSRAAGTDISSMRRAVVDAVRGVVRQLSRLRRTPVGYAEPGGISADCRGDGETDTGHEVVLLVHSAPTDTTKRTLLFEAPATARPHQPALPSGVSQMGALAWPQVGSRACVHAPVSCAPYVDDSTSMTCALSATESSRRSSTASTTDVIRSDQQPSGRSNR